MIAPHIVREIADRMNQIEESRRQEEQRRKEASDWFAVMVVAAGIGLIALVGLL